MKFKSKCSTKSFLQQYECGVILKNKSQKLITVDGCLWQEILYLWQKGIETIGCCCGHHENLATDIGYIQVQENCIQKMIDLGYTAYVNEFGNTIFKPKTIIIKEKE